MRKANTVMLAKYYAGFLSLELKQLEAGPRSSGTPVLADNIFIFYENFDRRV